MNPALADLTGDGLSEVILGTGGYLVRAIDHQGNEAPGFPKSTGGWIISSPAVGDFDGDGKFELTTLTRNGWLFIWDTDAPTTNRLDWQSFGHDAANTNNYHTPLPRYGAVARCGDGNLDNGEACDGPSLGGKTCQDAGDFTGGALACNDDCTLDTSACEAAGNNTNNANNNTNNANNNTNNANNNTNNANNANNSANNGGANNGANNNSGGSGGGGGDEDDCSVAPAQGSARGLLPLGLLLLGLAWARRRR
jgi:MYXO-CTERM domain-containing protein